GLPPAGVVIGAAGGSLGSRRINEAVLGLVARWAGRPGVAVRHAVGSRDWAEVSGRLPPPEPGGLVYQPVEYEGRMPLLLAAADVMVGRAGGTTVAELVTVGLPAVLVPLPIAPGDHQTANGMALARAGAALVVADAELSADRLAIELEPLLADPDRLGAMGTAARTLARPDAAQRVAALVEEHARG
ncbi:MAG: UDP-N-acetylglucosamine--N-acetylmuramyl-(pentapeptide) pyrophosphoryl-undecaprenol N-acetylglucosamine transferase, partial [Acidimicrobiales bacterium]